MRTVEEIKLELEKWKREKNELENEIDRASPIAFDYLNNLDKELYKTHCVIGLLEWVLGQQEKTKDRLKEIWERQQNFDNIAFQNAATTREDTTLHRKVALITEIGELFNEIPDFKYWKKNKNTEITDKTKEEFADVLHFVFSIGIDVFENEQEMFEWYCKKNDKNLLRQKTGY
ncbi:dUTPase [Fusobacterium necrophorum]|uniref:dUTPase n=1 Tax=Fusobacterium necrophorum TaxID=859 RepID=UPI00370F6A65